MAGRIQRADKQFIQMSQIEIDCAYVLNDFVVAIILNFRVTVYCFEFILRIVLKNRHIFVLLKLYFQAIVQVGERLPFCAARNPVFQNVVKEILGNKCSEAFTLVEASLPEHDFKVTG